MKRECVPTQLSDYLLKEHITKIEESVDQWRKRLRACRKLEGITSLFHEHQYTINHILRPMYVKNGVVVYNFDYPQVKGKSRFQSVKAAEASLCHCSKCLVDNLMRASTCGNMACAA